LYAGTFALSQNTAMPLALYRFPFRAMGSPCEIQLYSDDKRHAQSVADKAMADVRRIEARYSRYREGSVLSGINRVAAKGGMVAIDEETAALLNYADTCYQQSEGLFDISSGVLRKAWDFKAQKTPKKAVIKQLLSVVGWDKVQLSATQISFKRPGMQLDFGGIGKEYAVDRAAAICKEQGIEHGLVDLGGDIKIIGPHADGRSWSVGLRHPRKPDALLATVKVYAGAVASSGDYERCIVVNGRRYGHVLNPKTGWPVNGLVGVTVLAEHCVIAGSACTIAMLMESNGKQWLEALGLQHIWMDPHGEIGGQLGLR
jgi:thiamine biosynthesis lipoprotein